MDAVNKLKKAASVKDDKINELQRVIESERAVFRKAESDKLALQKQLESLREELQLSQRSLMSSRSLSRRKMGEEDGSTSIRVRPRRTPPMQPTLIESPTEGSSSNTKRSGSRSIRAPEKSSVKSRLFGRKKSVQPEEDSPKSKAETTTLRPGHRKSVSMTTREMSKYGSGQTVNPRRVAMKKSESQNSRESKWR